MADSKYPSEFDSDIELPRVDDNISEIGGEAINGLRSAVFSIEETLGLNLQGTSSDLTTRLSTSLNPDGSLKAAALTSIGLVTLPIDNAQVGSAAGIEESKLDLDYSTVTLRQLIASLDVFVNAINDNLIQDISNLIQHIAHPGNFGRHNTQDVDGYTGKFASYNLQGIITDIDDRLVDHVDQAKIEAHLASNVSVDDTYTVISADNMQAAVEELDRLQEVLSIIHRDEFHSNGILQTQDVPLDGYDHAKILVESAALVGTGVGNTYVQFTAAPAGLAGVVRGDRIDVTLPSGTFEFIINSVNIPNSIVDIFGTVPEATASASAIIYRTTTETSAPSVLAIARRQDDIIQLVHPSSPFVLSVGIDPRRITTITKNIRLRWNKSDTGDLDIRAALNTFISPTPSTWTPENVAIALNELFRAESPSVNHFPFIAFTYNGELGIAFDEPDGYLEVVAPSTLSAWSVLGFTEGDIVLSSNPRKFFIDGYEFSGIHKKIQTTGEIAPGGIINIASGILASAGVVAGDLVRVAGSSSANDNRTLVIDGVGPTTILVNPSEHVFPLAGVGSIVTIDIYSDSFSVATPPSVSTLYELFVDAYDTNSAKLRGSVRASYSKESSSTENLEPAFSIVDVSRNFTASKRRIFFDQSENTVQLGQQGTGFTLISGTGGPSVILPTSPAQGFRFKLFDANRVEYLEIEIATTTSFSNDNGLDVDIFDRISEEKFVQLGVVLHNTSEFKHLSDRRLFGTVGRKDLRDDAIRDFIDYPRSQLRGGGVLYGLNVGSRSDGYIDAYGGVALTNGTLRSIDTAEIAIPSDGATSTYNLFVDENGILRFLKNDQLSPIIGALPTPSLEEILLSDNKTIIAQADVSSSNVVTAIRDYRRFVGNIDNKLELIAEENSITHGSFASLQSAVNWINAHDSASLPVSRTIRVRGVLNVDLSLGAVQLPDGIAVVGDSFSENTAVLASTISFTNTGATGVLPGNGCTFENVLFEVATGGNVTNMIGDTSTIIRNLTVKNCTFNLTPVSIASGIKATDIFNSRFDGCNFIGPATSGSVEGIRTTGSMKNVTVTDGYFSGLGVGVEAFAGAENVLVNNNIFEKVYSKGVSLRSSIGSIISNNMFSADAPASGFVFTEDTGQDIVITGNIFKVTSVSTTGTLIESAALYATISNNVSDDSSTSGIVGIDLTGAVSKIATISGNVLQTSSTVVDFAGGFPGVVAPTINGNYFVNRGGSKVINISGGTVNPMIQNNILAGTGSSVIIDISAGSVASITGNYISVSESVAISASQLNIISDNTIISDNIFLFGPTAPTTHSARIITSSADDVTITANVFINTLSAVTFTNEPILLSGDRAYVYGNNFSSLTLPSGGAMSLTGTGSSDLLNKGQTYSIPIPLSSASPNGVGSSTHVWTWYCDNGVFETKGQLSTAGNAYTTADGVAIEFSTRDIPIGATIVKVELGYTRDGVSGTGWDMTLRKQDPLTIGASATIIGSNIAMPGSSGAAATVSSTGLTEVITNGNVYMVFVRPTSALSETVIIFGLVVTYLL